MSGAKMHVVQTKRVCCICQLPSVGGLGSHLLCGQCMDDVSDVKSDRRYSYVELRLAGQSHNLAAMFAEQRAPQGIGDKTFNAGVNPGGNQFADNPALGDYYAREARAKGINISGATYLSGMARYPGDPEAFIRDRGDIRRICEERGWSCDGAVKVGSRQYDDAPAAGPGVADDLIASEMADRMAANPELRPSEELWHQTRDDIKPSWVD